MNATPAPLVMTAPAPPNSFDADVMLVEALRAGRGGAIEEMWHRHAGMVRGVLRRLLGPDQDVEDLLQETFIHFFRQVRGLRDPRALRMFLITIATNVVRGEFRMRRVRRWIRPTDTGALPDIPSQGNDIEARHALRRFYEILDGLSAHDRTAFVLRYVEDMDLAEVACACGVSLATIKRHLKKISEKVMDKMGEDRWLADFLGRKGFPDAT